MKEFTIVRGLFDTRKRQLIIDPNFIKFENKDKLNDLFTIIPKENIAGIRYGIHFIKGYDFYIGREYQIFIRSKSGDELKIFFKLFYRRKLNAKHDLYCSIINSLWEYYLNEILDNYIRSIKEKSEIKISGVVLRENYLETNKLKISYKDLEVKKYHHYFIIYSNEDPYLNKMFYYLDDKDAVILIEILEWIIDNKSVF